MSYKNPSLRRIQQDILELQRDPSNMYYAAPLEEDMFHWHFTLRGPPKTDYDGGVYHGEILLPATYPFKPPNIVFLTPNGRFQVGVKICLSATAYHPEHWQPAWGIRLLLEALISFFPTPTDGAIGALDWKPDERRRLAASSSSYCCAKCGITSRLLLPFLPSDSSSKLLSPSSNPILGHLAEAAAAAALASPATPIGGGQPPLFSPSPGAVGKAPLPPGVVPPLPNDSSPSGSPDFMRPGGTSVATFRSAAPVSDASSPLLGGGGGGVSAGRFGGASSSAPPRAALSSFLPASPLQSPSPSVVSSSSVPSSPAAVVLRRPLASVSAALLTPAPPGVAGGGGGPSDGGSSSPQLSAAAGEPTTTVDDDAAPPSDLRPPSHPCSPRSSSSSNSTEPPRSPAVVLPQHRMPAFQPPPALAVVNPLRLPNDDDDVALRRRRQGLVLAVAPFWDWSDPGVHAIVLLGCIVGMMLLRKLGNVHGDVDSFLRGEAVTM